MSINITCVTDNCPIQTYTATPGQSFACPVCHVAGTWTLAEDVSSEAAAETPFTIEDFVAALQAKSDAYYAENFPSMDKPTYGVSAPGKKFQRVWVESYGQTSVHCFVNRDGWVFKAANWKAPASGVRYPSMEAAAEAFNGNGTGYLYAK